MLRPPVGGHGHQDRREEGRIDTAAADNRPPSVQPVQHIDVLRSSETLVRIV